MTSHQQAQDNEDEDGDDDGSDPELESLESLNEGKLSLALIDLEIQSSSLKNVF